MEFRKHTLAALLAASALTLAACGSDNDSPAPPTGGNPDPDPTLNDPFPVSDWFIGASATPALNNRTDVAPGLDDKGYPTASSPELKGADYAFTAPATHQGHTVPAYFVDTDYIGAFDPDVAFDNQWTADWTVKVHGNDAVWGPAAGGTLAGAAATADDTCPAGTTLLADTFATRFAVGDITNDEAGIFTAGADYDVCQLPARITADITLTNDNVYELAEAAPGTLVGDGEGEDVTSPTAVTVTIEPGTLVFGDTQNAFFFTRGSSINAQGTAANPIVMTSEAQLTGRFDGDTGTDIDGGRGEWSGLVLNGFARSNECGGAFDGCDVAAEGIQNAFYGGNDDADSSGTLNYVVIRHAGFDLDGNGSELNGLTLNATGSGTDIQYVQIHRGLDDGFEHFGAASFVSHMVVTGAGDDSVDWGQGWTGGAQFVLVLQEDDAGDRMIEADNDGDNNELEPISFPVLANMTMVGQSALDSAGVMLRRGTKAQIWNAIVTGSATCIDLDDDATFARAGDTAPDAPGDELVFRNSIASCATNFDEE